MFKLKNKSTETVLASNLTESNINNKTNNFLQTDDTDITKSFKIQAANKKKKTLHEVTTKNFNRTPKGLIFSKDTKDIFCIILLCLDMNGKLTKNTSKRKLFTSKETRNNESDSYFTFLSKTCIETMEKLNINIDMDSTTVSISYSIKPEMSIQLIKLFISSKLLHIPNDRTRSEPKDKAILQPTPKGVAILTKYVKDMGIKNIPPILYSTLNSAKLFCFERSGITDRIIFNDYFIKLIFINMLGDFPNIWSPNMQNDKIPPLKELLERTNDIFSFDDCNFSGANTETVLKILNEGKKKQNNNDYDDETNESKNPFSDENALSDNISEELLSDSNRISPLTHKFFTNPDSDAHVQYYSTRSGLRLWHNREFSIKENEKKVIPYCFSTKAIVQWLMDCTDLIYFKEAIIIASLFYKTGLIIPIVMPPSQSSVNKFTFSKKNLYTFSREGCACLKWDDKFKQQIYPDWNKKQHQNQVENTDVFKVYQCNNSEEIFSIRSDEQIDNTDVKKNSISDDKKIESLEQKNSKNSTLEAILNDPGKRFLFQSHLNKELCAENFYAYSDIKKFLKKMDLLENLIYSRVKNKQLHEHGVKATTVYSSINNALIKEADDCLSMIYQIFSTYIAQGSPRLINIDYKLRSSISLVILGSSSPISAKVNELLKKKGSCLNLSDTEEEEREIKKIRETTSKAIELNDSSKNQILKLDNIPINNLKRDDKPQKLDILNFKNVQIVNSNSDCLISTKILNSELSETSTDTIIKQSVFILTKLKPLFEEVNMKLYKIMETDSLPKFLNNESI
ncbi:hypothetical protein ACO0SA_004635 [Hanseniaspora valbyensis]